MRCVWLLGHSEGGLIALAAAQQPHGICGLILVASPGRKLGAVLREQLQANPANAPLLPQALAAIDTLEAGKPVDVAGMPAPLLALFRPQVQPFLIDLLKQDPQALVGHTTMPVLIVQGGKDRRFPQPTPMRCTGRARIAVADGPENEPRPQGRRGR